MSENLKRAESLFNRIMNPNKPQSGGESGTQKYHKSSSHNQHQSSEDPPRGNGRHSNNHSNGHSNIHSNGHSNGHPNGNANGNGHHRYNTRSYHKFQAPPAASFDLPKRNPEKEAKDAVAALVENLHVLPYCWTIWYHSRSKTKTPITTEEPGSNSVAGTETAKTGSAAVDSYLQAATEIAFPCFGRPEQTVKPIASLEQMWVSLSALKKSHELANGSELLIFKAGVNPVWEDPINSRGGRWVFRFSHRVNPNAASQESQDSIQKGRRRATLVWERLVLKTLTGSILLGRKEHHDALLSDIVGLVLSVRRDEEIISIWNSNSHVGKKGKDDDDKKGVAGFHARRVYCDAILRVIREVDAIMQGSDFVETQLSSSNERVSGVTFEYRLHADNAHPYNSNERPRRGKGHHHHHQKEEEIQAQA